MSNAPSQSPVPSEASRRSGSGPRRSHSRTTRSGSNRSGPTYKTYDGRQTDLASWDPNEREPGARESRGDKSFSYCALRPFVRSENRVSVWSSKFYVDRMAAVLDPRRRMMMSKGEEAVLDGLELDTRKIYGSGLKAFAAYCDEYDVPEEERVPASDELICSFVAMASLRKTSKSTMSTWIAGLRAWHLAQGAEWSLEGSSRFDMVRKAVAKHAPKTSSRPKRPPVTLRHLQLLAEKLDGRNSLDIAVKAVACVAFWACVRLGELVVKRADQAFDPDRLVAQDVAVSHESTRESNRPYIQFDIPWTKTTKNEGATIVLVPGEGGDQTCPVEALSWHRKVNSDQESPRHDRPLFSFKIREEPGWAPLTKDRFMARCNEIWAEGGLGRLTGHSFRIGGTTELLLQGVDPSVVKLRGRWKSDAFLLYWRKVDQVVPEFLLGRYSEDDVNAMRNRMAAWVDSAPESAE